jgi:hypothetical protein
MSVFPSIIQTKCIPFIVNVSSLFQEIVAAARHFLLGPDTYNEDTGVYYRMNCSHNINDDISLPLYMLFCYETIIPGIIVQCTNDDGTIFQETNVQGASVNVSAVVCGDFHPELECLLVQLLLLLLLLLLLRNTSQSF